MGRTPVKLGLGATVAQDLEPENRTISSNSRTAGVTLQENSALAIVDLRRGTIKRLVPLGYKMHLLSGNELDASDKDDAINIQSCPVMGMYQPNTIASFTSGRKTWSITANEGDSRDYIYEVLRRGFDVSRKMAQLDTHEAWGITIASYRCRAVGWASSRVPG